MIEDDKRRRKSPRRPEIVELLKSRRIPEIIHELDVSESLVRSVRKEMEPVPIPVPKPSPPVEPDRTPLEQAKEKLRQAGYAQVIRQGARRVEIFKGRSRGPDWITEEAGKL